MKLIGHRGSGQHNFNQIILIREYLANPFSQRFIHLLKKLNTH